MKPFKKFVMIREPAEADPSIRLIAECTAFSAYVIREQFTEETGWIPIETIGVSKEKLEEILAAMGQIGNE